MSHHDSSETQMQELLNSVTDALLYGRGDVDRIIDQGRVPRSRVEDLVELVYSLNMALVSQQPSDRFVKRLKQDLIGQRTGLVNRFRFLPARVQIATGLALVAGFVLLTRRRLTPAEDGAEIPVLQQ
jgi:hypothetical protein